MAMTLIGGGPLILRPQDRNLVATVDFTGTNPLILAPGESVVSATAQMWSAPAGSISPSTDVTTSIIAGANVTPFTIPVVANVAAVLIGKASGATGIVYGTTYWLYVVAITNAAAPRTIENWSNPINVDTAN